MKTKQILKKLVSFDTVLDKQNKEIMNWLQIYLGQVGFFTETIKNQGKTALWARFGENQETGLTFVGHTDTVPAGEGWQSNPFELFEKGDKLYGLGTSDMKGGIAVFLEVVGEIDQKKLKKNIEIILTYDEENNFEGIKDFLKKKNIKSDIFLIGEPTDNIPVVAHKGVLAFRVIFSGKSCHGSHPEDGDNAIYYALDVAKKLKDYSEEIKNIKNQNNFNPPGASFNLGKLVGGDAINKVPDKCYLEFEWRVPGEEQTEEIREKVFDIVKESGGRAEVEILLDMPSVQSEKDFVEKIELILETKAIAENYTTEASFLDKKNVVILGPGPMNAHIVNEFVSQKSVLKTVEIYRKLIGEFCEIKY